MADSSSRMERLLVILGGEENLPPRAKPVLAKVDKPLSPKPLDIVVDSVSVTQPKATVHSNTPSAPAKLQKSAEPNPVQPEVARYPFDIRKGESSTLGISFVPFQALTKYCYKYIPNHLGQRVASAFFDANKIYDTRTWDLYFVSTDYSGVRTFVTEDQLQNLIDDINSELKTKLAITDHNRANGLLIDFDDVSDILRPRWLGHCSSREQYLDWTSRLESEPQMALNERLAGRADLEAFKAKMDEAAEASKNRSKAKQSKKHGEVIIRRQDMARQNLRAQRYLALMSKDENLESNLIDWNMSLDFPTPYNFESDVIFIAIDVEAKEKASHEITEVGVATLDTRDLHDAAPGNSGTDWHKHIRARHFRISEHRNHVNREYVQGCPENFAFGTSEFVKIADIGKALTACFHEPFSRLDSSTKPTHPPGERRNLVIVGHDLGSDVNYCRKIGFDIFNRGNILDTLDTTAMYRAYENNPNSTSLGRILYDFDLVGWHLHNAGNDAVYTIQAMLAVCVNSAMRKGSTEAAQQSEAAKEQRKEAFVERALENAQLASEGWDLPPDADGGVPVLPENGSGDTERRHD